VKLEWSVITSACFPFFLPEGKIEELAFLHDETPIFFSSPKSSREFRPLRSPDSPVVGKSSQLSPSPPLLGKARD